MSYFIFVNLILSVFYRNAECIVQVRKFVYQKDISEHCRRSVVPSVFLGTHVMEAHSQILHFSHLEVPYSCFISIRAESGNNIVLVFQVPPSDSGDRSCIGHTDTGSPVSVYEMGETFGGYWGPIPPDFVTNGKNTIVEKYYTQRTKPDTTTKVYEEETTLDNTEEDKNVTRIGPSQIPPVVDNGSKVQSYLSFEVPLLKVSGKLVPGDQINETDDDPENDEKYDFPEIVPKRGESYDTTIIPILQYSQMGPRAGRVEDDGKNPEPRYQLDYNLGGATLDPRLTNLFDFGGVTKRIKFHRKLNRLLNFNKHKRPFFSARRTTFSSRKSKYNNDTWFHIEALLKNVTNESVTQSDKENLLQSEKYAALLHKMADWQQNYSIYLAPDLLSFDNHSLDLNKVLQLDISTSTVLPTLLTSNSMQTSDNLVINTVGSPIKLSQMELQSPISALNDVNKTLPSTTNHSRLEITSSENIATDTNFSFITSTINISNDFATFYSSEKATLPTPATSSKVTGSIATTQHIGSFTSNITEKIFGTTTTKTVRTYKSEDNGRPNANLILNTSINRPTIVSTVMPTKDLIGSIVDRESWENVVQVAPRMAGLLSEKTLATMSPEKPRKSSYVTKVQNKDKYQSVKVKLKRKKRSIQAIPIDSERPHNLTTDPDVVTTPEAMYSFSDLYDFAKLFELQDDNLYGHLALHYMQHHVGKKVFDLCKENQSKSRYVHLFNTSRIVIALNQFTWKRMTIVATPVRTLTGGSLQCDRSSLECQVSGARVCIDNLNACDGIPNCGTYDIYDEDRLKCGGAKGLQHNVIIAAFTFLAVLLTLFYTVYYWLKRCVPKVSEAFFIYTDGTENLLHLNSIMKSPLLLNESSSRQLVYQSHLFEADIKGFCAREKISVFKRIFGCFTRRKTKYDAFRLSAEFNENQLGRMFSFPEMEINKMANPRCFEVSVQTGESLEMTYIKKRESDGSSMLIKQKSFEDFAPKRKPHLSPVFESRDQFPAFGSLNEEEEHDTAHRVSVDNELSMLKFLRDARLSSMEWTESEINQPSRNSNSLRPLAVREKELRSTVYDRSTLNSSMESTKGIMPALEPVSLASISEENLNLDVPGPSGLTGKRLRFDDNLTTVSSMEVLQNLGQTNSSEADLEPSAVSTGRDFIRFWSKKGHKKKSQLNK